MAMKIISMTKTHGRGRKKEEEKNFINFVFFLVVHVTLKRACSNFLCLIRASTKKNLKFNSKALHIPLLIMVYGDYNFIVVESLLCYDPAYLG